MEGLLSKMRAERIRTRRTTRMRWLTAAAVVLVAAAVGFSVVRTSQEGTNPPQAEPSPQLISARFEPTAGSGLSGEATLTPKTWGVSVSLNVTRLPGAGPYICQVHNNNGGVEQAAAWGSTPSGNAKVTGASSTQIRDVSSVSIADNKGRVLGEAPLN